MQLSSSPYHKLKTFSTLVLLLLATQISWAVEISVSVDRNPVAIDESFNIYFTAPESPSGEPDFSLLEQDFTILNQNQSSNSSWINGQYSKSIRWTVQAMAKKSGNLTIPAIIFGDDTSKPLPLTVNQGGESADNANDQDLFLEVKATPDNPYVQAQVIYTVKLYRRVEITQASLGEPELTDAVVEKLGEDNNYNTMINGVSYVVTERKYAIFPQKSGVLKIKPLALNAEIVTNNPRSFGDFFGSQMTKTKRVLSKEIVLNVKPAPASFNGKNWLPAESLELAQTWSGDTQHMNIGEPLTRTLTLRGTGTTVGKLPELNTVKTDSNLKAYPDQPVLNEEKLPDAISASRQEKIALIPSAAGKQTLPAIEIPWFNTKTEHMEIARIPETVIQIAGNANVTQPNSTPQAQSKSQPLTEDTQKSIVSETSKTVLVQPAENTIWQWLSLFLGLGWLFTLVYFLSKRPKTSMTNDQMAETLQNEIKLKEINRQLKQACNQNDSLAAKNALLEWGNQHFGTRSLGTIANHSEARLRDEILLLNQHLYSKEANEWNGKKLFQAFMEHNARKKIDKVEDIALEPLSRL